MTILVCHLPIVAGARGGLDLSIGDDVAAVGAELAADVGIAADLDAALHGIDAICPETSLHANGATIEALGIDRPGDFDGFSVDGLCGQ